VEEGVVVVVEVEEVEEEEEEEEEKEEEEADLHMCHFPRYGYVFAYF
jgi:hypothetical protein